MIITFGNYRLVPVDSNNWELEHFFLATKGFAKNNDTPKWYKMGHYYHLDTIGRALAYSVDEEIKMKDGELTFSEYLELADKMRNEFYAEVTEQLKAHSKQLTDNL